MNDRKFINPLEIPERDLPLFVFSDDRKGFIGWAIKTHSNGNYNHTMIMLEPEKIVTQGLTYKQIPIKDYMKKNQFLKFWQYTKITKEEKELIYNAVNRDLKQPAWRRSYDFLGILGQAIHIRWLQNPFKKYCSERVASYLRLILNLKYKIPQRPSPAELNKLFHNIDGFIEYGYWWGD